MKQYLDEQQTAKLIELGLPKPKSIEKMMPQPVVDGYVHLVPQKAYSIGELIDMLPDYINGNFVNWKIQTTRGDAKWSVGWDCFETGQFQWIRTTELIDALYDMIVKLKEEGVI